MNKIVIVAAKRTPFGRFHGGLSKFSPIDLAVAAGRAALERIDPALIDQVILGNVLAAGHGMNIARQVAVQLQLPVSTPAMTVNMMCGSGLQTVMLGVNAIRAGDANVVLAGGTESMTQSHLLVKRPGKREDPDFDEVIDTMQQDGLIDSFDDLHMGAQAEQLATEFAILREQQDRFAWRSQHLYETARQAGKYADELVPAGDLIADEHPRADVTFETLGELTPVFRKDGTVTAGNSSGINDGAAMLLLADREFATSNNWPILAEWVNGVTVGCEPVRMGLGPVHAISELMKRTARTWTDIDTLEINEAFAAQTLSCLKQMELEWPSSPGQRQIATPAGNSIDFNSEGGAIALGHPLAVSGARLLCHLAWKIQHGDSRSAVASACVGGGMGVAALMKSADK